MRLLLVLLVAALALARGDAKCAMTQTCVNPGNVPDYDACIPEAHREPVDPQPVGALFLCGAGALLLATTTNAACTAVAVDGGAAVGEW